MATPPCITCTLYHSSQQAKEDFLSTPRGEGKNISESMCTYHDEGGHCQKVIHTYTTFHLLNLDMTSRSYIVHVHVHVRHSLTDRQM
jgi:hypothetical protein